MSMVRCPNWNALASMRHRVQRARCVCVCVCVDKVACIDVDKKYCYMRLRVREGVEGCLNGDTLEDCCATCRDLASRVRARCKMLDVRLRT